MKKLIFSLLLILILTASCGNTVKTQSTYSTVNKMELLQHEYFTRIQIDSVIVADSLKAFDKWHVNVLYNDDNRTKIEQRLFIKKCKDGSILNYSTTFSIETLGKYKFKKIKYNE